MIICRSDRLLSIVVGEEKDFLDVNFCKECLINFQITLKNKEKCYKINRQKRMKI